MSSCLQANDLTIQRNELQLDFAISSKELNRIIFPFPSLIVNTTSQAHIEKDGGYLYIMPAEGEDHITLYVSDATGESSATYQINLQISDITPQDTILNLPAKYQPKPELPESTSFVPTSSAYEQQLAEYVQEIWRNFLQGKDEILPGFAVTYNQQALQDKMLLQEDEQPLSIRLCDAYMPETTLFSIPTDNYQFAMVRLVNPLPIAQEINCQNTTIGWSALNSTVIEPHGSLNVLVINQVTN